MALVLYVVLPKALVIQPRWLFPALEAALLIPLSFGRPDRRTEDLVARGLTVVLIVLVNVTNAVSVGLLVAHLLNGEPTKGTNLIFSAVSIWATNVIVYGLWFWELDRGGPGVRATERERNPDFLYPQMTSPDVAPEGWRPSFLDYLYVAFTNATAFSPTDTMPLTPVAKALMSVESLVALITVVVVAARAVNILTG